MEGITFQEVSDDDKEKLLDILGFSVDENKKLINKETGRPHVCEFSGEEICLSEASIMPWESFKVIKTTPQAVSKYFAEYRKLQDGKG